MTISGKTVGLWERRCAVCGHAMKLHTLGALGRCHGRQDGDKRRSCYCTAFAETTPAEPQAGEGTTPCRCIACLVARGVVERPEGGVNGECHIHSEMQPREEWPDDGWEREDAMDGVTSEGVER